MIRWPDHRLGEEFRSYMILHVTARTHFAWAFLVSARQLFKVLADLAAAGDRAALPMIPEATHLQAIRVTASFPCLHVVLPALDGELESVHVLKEPRLGLIIEVNV